MAPVSRGHILKLTIMNYKDTLRELLYHAKVYKNNIINYEDIKQAFEEILDNYDSHTSN